MSKKRAIIIGSSIFSIIIVLFIFFLLISNNDTITDRDERHLHYLEEKIQDSLINLKFIKSTLVELQYDKSGYKAKISVIMQENEMLSVTNKEEIKKFLTTVLTDISDDDIVINVSNEKQ